MTLAIVTPWFGADLTGGAERLAWEVSHRLARRGHDVAVLTTCARSFSTDWSENFHPPGTTASGPLTVKRFRVDSRDPREFDRVNQALLQLQPSQLRRGVSPVSADVADAFIANSINSTALSTHLREADGGYEKVLFIPYLYGTTLNTWRFVADRAFLQPCLHDEAYAYLPAIAEMMRGVRGILFNSDGEAEIAQRLYGPGIAARSLTIGSGIEPPQQVTFSDSWIAQKTGGRRFALYLGRRDQTKNVPFLCDRFRAFTADGDTLALVLAGPGEANFSDKAARIVDVGFVSEAQKQQLLDNCAVLVQPSKNESYSRAMMEAWINGKPVIVNSEAAAMRMAVAATQAGWLAGSGADWNDALQFVAASLPETLAEIGSRAAWYVEQFAGWPAVLDRYEQTFELGGAAQTGAQPQVHQFVENLEYADPVAIQAMALRSSLWDAGYDSRIFTTHVDERMEHQGFVQPPPRDASLIVHVSDNMGPVRAFSGHPHGKILIDHRGLLDESLADAVRNYDGVFESVAGAAPTVAARLTLPVGEFMPLVDPARWNVAHDATLMNALQDGRTNIICVRPIARGYAQHELIQVFAHYLTMDLNARLILAGAFDFEDPYYHELLRVLHAGSLSQQVLITGLVSEPALAAIYATAHVYCTLSDHETHSTALLEAMWFGVPVVAYKNAATARILGNAGLLLRDKSDHLRVAALLRVLVDDQKTRSAVLESQDARLRSVDRVARRDAAAALTSRLNQMLAGRTA